MFQSRKLNTHINRLHVRALEVVWRDFDSSFEELHKTAVQPYTNEIYKN